MRTFKQITRRDRLMISKLRTCGFSISEIARRIGKNKSTISRELKRNANVSSIDDQLFYLAAEKGLFPDELKKISRQIGLGTLRVKRTWSAVTAEEMASHRRLLSNQMRVQKTKATKNWAIEKLREGWTPEQIAGRSSKDGPEKVSHEYVYQIIKKDRHAGGKLFRLLPRFRKHKQRFNARIYGHKIKGKVHISLRPKVVEQRQRLGDLEADLIQGYKQSGYILTVVDRKSRLVILRKLKTKSSLSVARELTFAARKFRVAKTITTDNGHEFAHHRRIAQQAKIDFYFATAHSSFERGTVENTNGLIRRIYPKQTCFKDIKQLDLNRIQENLNTRPRKVLNFLTPQEVHFNSQSRTSTRCI